VYYVLEQQVTNYVSDLRLTPGTNMENPTNYEPDDLEELDSPLVQALREHLARYYPSGSDEPFSSRNLVNPCLQRTNDV
jgi:hypothetical protein